MSGLLSARTGLVALAASLAFALLASVTAANADERGQGIKKHGSQQAQAQQRGLQHAQAGHAKGRHRAPAEAVECGDVLSEPGNYSLNSDLVCTSPINITGSNVHLDLAGHSISCDAENWQYTTPGDRYPQIVTGIFVNADSAIEWEESGSGIDELPQAPVLTGFKVKNGTIADCSFGMYFFKTDRSKVSNMHLDGNNVGRPEFNGATVGITMFASNDNHLFGNRVSGDGLYGFEITLSNGNQLKSNVLEGLGDTGIFLIGSSGNVLRKNTAVDNLSGIYLQPDFFWGVDVSADNVVASNNVSNNEFDGITLLGPTNGNVLRRNTVNHNGGIGVMLLGLAPFGLPVPSGNTIRGNTAFGNPTADLAEVDLDGNFVDLVIPDECSNLWKHNTFDTSLGPVDCIE